MRPKTNYYRVLELLTQSESPVNNRQIADELKLTFINTYAMLQQLINDGLVERHETTHRVAHTVGRNPIYYRAVEQITPSKS